MYEPENTNAWKFRRVKFSQSPILAPKWASNNALGQVQKLLIWCLLSLSQITWVFQKKLCPKLGDLFLNWQKRVFFCKSNCTGGKRHYQLAKLPKFSQFRLTMTKIITHLSNTNIWKLEVKTRLHLNQTIISFYWQLHFRCKIAHWKVGSNLD
jgi:hypothetical protein